MNILICGAGEVGRHLTEVMAPAGHNITILDRDESRIQEMGDWVDARLMVGDAVHAGDLLEAGAARADLMVAATNRDEINLLAASIGKALGSVKCIARVHHAAFFERHGLDYGRHLGIDHLVCPEFSTAQAIAATLRSPGALAVESFARGQIQMQRMVVSPRAPVVGCSLREIHLPGSARIAAVEHQGHAAVPSADTRIYAGDVITLLGDTAHFAQACQFFDTGSGGRRKVMIMGGTALAVWLCRALQRWDFSVRLFESDPQRAAALSEKLERVTVLAADPMSGDVLQEERVDQADAFIALTDHDENNLLAAARARSMGVGMAIAVQQRGTYLHLLEHIGIDKAFSPRVTAVVEIQRLLQQGTVRTLASLAAGIADVFEIRVPQQGSAAVEKPLRDLKLPARCLIAAIQRSGEIFVPGAQDMVRGGDRVVAIGPAASRKELARLFGR